MYCTVQYSAVSSNSAVGTLQVLYIASESLHQREHDHPFFVGCYCHASDATAMKQPSSGSQCFEGNNIVGTEFRFLG